MPASTSPMTTPRKTKAVRMRTISGLGFQPLASGGLLVVIRPLRRCAPPPHCMGRRSPWWSSGPSRDLLIFGSRPESTSPRRVVRQSCLEVVDTEVGPQGFGHEHLRVRPLPEQEVADSPLPGGPDDEVGIGKLRLVHVRRDGVFIDISP